MFAIRFFLFFSSCCRAVSAQTIAKLMVGVQYFRAVCFHSFFCSLFIPFDPRYFSLFLPLFSLF
jgi:hypothetical protein